MSYRGEEVYQYYYVVHDLRIITWLEDLDGYLLFRECIQASEWRHKSALLCNYLFFFSIVLYRARTRGSVLVSGQTNIVSLILMLQCFTGDTLNFFRTSSTWQAHTLDAHAEKFFATLEVSPILLQWYLELPERIIEATTLNQSTAATIFWTLDQMRQVDVQLASVGMCPKSCPAEHRDDRETEALAENEIVEDTGIVLCCMWAQHRRAI